MMWTELKRVAYRDPQAEGGWRAVWFSLNIMDASPYEDNVWFELGSA